MKAPQLTADNGVIGKVKEQRSSVALCSAINLYMKYWTNRPVQSKQTTRQYIDFNGAWIIEYLNK